MEDGLYSALARVLKASKKPITNVEAMKDTEVFKLSNGDSTTVSNYLGNMWRKGSVKRVPAYLSDSPGTKTRFAYQWPIENQEGGAGTSLLDTPKVKISRDGKSITISLPNLSISIDQT